MIDTATRAHACRVFEETLQDMLTRYALAELALLACTLPDTDGVSVVVAQYWVYPDGTFVLAEDADA